MVPQGKTTGGVVELWFVFVWLWMLPHSLSQPLKTHCLVRPSSGSYLSIRVVKIFRLSKQHPIRPRSTSICECKRDT
ncbi:hypothetical protein F5B18DRAFT_470467 [Nemania serpens]|nr:hypothetical protein F5B18DRAFT_470467 [Nemania serpens]